MITSEVQVQVRVSVDKTGKVVAAEPIGKGPLADYLGKAAAAAARLWSFEPACKGNLTLPGELILQFRFTFSQQ